MTGKLYLIIHSMRCKPLFPISEIRNHPDGKTCKTCAFLLRVRPHDKTYFKCAIKGDTHSEATDIRLKNPACVRYKEKP